MKHFCFTSIILTLVSINGLAQKSISDMPTAHSKVLQEYLAKNLKLKFLCEKSYDKEYLKVVHQDFGTRFTPFNQRGDFNRDGKQDFAVILAKNVPPKRVADLAASHQLE